MLLGPSEAIPVFCCVPDWATTRARHIVRSACWRICLLPRAIPPCGSTIWARATPAMPTLEECLAVWQGCVHGAADWLRETTGVTRIAIVGLRFGAAIAMLAAAAREDVAGLMLLEPVLRGKSYVGQLVMEARLRSHFVAAPDDRLELDELRLTGETVGLMRQLDLRQIKPPPGCAVSIFTQSQSPVLSGCLNAWRDAGAMSWWTLLPVSKRSCVRPIWQTSRAAISRPSCHGCVRRSRAARVSRDHPTSTSVDRASTHWMGGDPGSFWCR